MKTEFDTIVNKLIKCDSDRLQQIVQALVTNAFKFTQGQDSEVCVKAKLRQSPFGSSILSIKVEDAGIGIDQIEVDKVFEPLFLS